MSLKLKNALPRQLKPYRPDFMQGRLDTFYSRLEESTGGENAYQTGQALKQGDLSLMSNDYLAVYHHPDIVAAQIASLSDRLEQSEEPEDFLFGSNVFLHESNPQHLLEKEFAAFLDFESTILTQSGWVANTGLIPSIAGKDTPIYIDVLAHTSLWEGASLAGGQIKPFRHNSPVSLEKNIRKYGAGIILVDSVYSTMGDICPLSQIAALSTANGCVLVVDESHSLGTHGPEGSGLVTALGLKNQVDFITASLAKSFAGRAGIIACSEEMANYLPYESRPAVFSSVLLPHEIEGLRVTLKVIREESWRRKKVNSNASYLRAGLSFAGYNVEASESQIIALEAGEDFRVVKLRDVLEGNGIFGSLFSWPSTPKKRSLIRFSVHSELSQAELDRIIHVCTEIRDEVEMWDWTSTKRKHQMAA